MRIAPLIMAACLGMPLWGADLYQQDVDAAVAKLGQAQPAVRKAGVESLGLLRARSHARDVAARLGDPAEDVRTQAAIALGWCGGREQIPALLTALDDGAWTVRQAAAISLGNLTGSDLPFNALTETAARAAQAAGWRTWWATVPADRLPPEVLAGLQQTKDRHLQLRAVRASGYLAGTEAVEPLGRILATIHYAQSDPVTREVARSTCRALGMIGGPSAQRCLLSSLNDVPLTRYVAYALGGCGDSEAADRLVAALPSFLPKILGHHDGQDPNHGSDEVDDGKRRSDFSRPGSRPEKAPADDLPNFDPSDRMYETPFAIAAAIDRLEMSSATRDRLAGMMPLLLNGLPCAYDGGMNYEEEACFRVVASLLDRTGLRDQLCQQVFRTLGVEAEGTLTPFQAALAAPLAKRCYDVPHRNVWAGELAHRPQDFDHQLALLAKDQPWTRLYAAKALALMRDPRAAQPLAALLAASRSEASYGYGKKVSGDEYNCPTPRWREGAVRALGRCGSDAQVPLLATLLADEGNAVEVRNACANALAELGSPAALAVLAQAERDHPLKQVQVIAREALWRHGVEPQPRAPVSPQPALPAAAPGPVLTDVVPALVFISGPQAMPNDPGPGQIDPYRQTYTTTDAGPVYRVGHNLMRLSPVAPDGTVTPITAFTDGWVGDCEVSYDGTRVLFSRRSQSDPWWHIYEVGADGSGLRQLTFGNYADVGPIYLPDGRIAFSSTRLGVRDEYHGFLSNGMTVMNPDGSDLHVIGLNTGRDNDPCVLPDGRIGFTRLEVFYSRLKTENVLEAMVADGTRNETLYGPERRDFWAKKNSEAMDNTGWSQSGNRHRALRLTQMQPWRDGRLLTMTSLGPVITGPGKSSETFIAHDPQRMFCSPWPMPDGRILCSTGMMPRRKGAVTDLGLAWLDADSGTVTPIYNNPATAEFEARPLMPRARPPVIAEAPRSTGYTGVLSCSSAFTTRLPEVKARGRYLRVVEGIPITGRVGSHVNSIPWRNHTGTIGRILGTVPLAADGSFSVEIPADRLVHLQILDPDRQVVGNQLLWTYVRPGEVRSCVGCHEDPATAPPVSAARALRMPSQGCLPVSGSEFLYRAKVWAKSTLVDEDEERTRVVRSFNLAAQP